MVLVSKNDHIYYLHRAERKRTNLRLDGSVVSGYVDVMRVSICQVSVCQLVLVCYEPQLIPQLSAACEETHNKTSYCQLGGWGVM